MAEAKKTGKAALRGVDGRQAAGRCAYTVGAGGSEFIFSVQLPGAANPQAVLQFGPDRGYRCLPPAPLPGPVKCPEAGVAAVWVLDGGKPALFGAVGSGPFDQAEARRRLLSQEEKRAAQTSQPEVRAAAIALPAVTPPTLIPKPSFREPVDRSESPFLSMEPKSGTATPPPVAGGGTATAVLPEAAIRAQSVPPPAGRAEQPALPPMPKGYPPSYRQPLVVKRAPRPTPRPPVYSPLWDDVSVEFEKMLENLPKSQPFNGSAGDAEIAELPTDGAVQCYVGSVTVNGMKVFLQAVPARPFGRPAGFDHSLVSRDGECYWVKYFIQSD